MGEQLCVKCLSETCPNAGYDTSIAKCAVYIPPKSITNADYIRSMSDEELATYLNNMQGLAYISGFDSEPIRFYPNNYGTWFNWLKQEVEDNNNDELHG